VRTEKKPSKGSLTGGEKQVRKHLPWHRFCEERGLNEKEGKRKNLVQMGKGIERLDETGRQDNGSRMKQRAQRTRPEKSWKREEWPWVLRGKKKNSVLLD